MTERNYSPLGTTARVVESHIVRDQHRLGLRDHEVDRAIELTKTLWRNKGIGEAAQQAADLIKKGL